MGLQTQQGAIIQEIHPARCTARTNRIPTDRLLHLDYTYATTAHSAFPRPESILIKSKGQRVKRLL